ncbi:hypothetical protein [Stenotrophomonas sp. Iso1]|uniref:hypothetical protein n=1 Tax=Stenotrophomonas sp. Iso1 TaxID=2977283 RepID=UPI0022B770B3|nr:hypothetical protein [Stenotrophomonas sp. Iso1]
MSGSIMRGALLCVVATLAACKPAEQEVVPADASASEVAPVAPTAAPTAAAPSDLGQLGELRINAPFGKAPADKAFVSAGMRELMEGDCEYYDGGTLPKGVSMMVIADKIARFEVDVADDPSIQVDMAPVDAPALPYGLWVGMTAIEAKRRLPAGVVTSPHAYASPDGDYLTWTDKTKSLALRLETLNGLVTSIYWGQPEAVELIEGCA